MQSYDVVIVGSGMGGGMTAYALKDTGLNVLLIERGDFLPREAENWSPVAVFDQKRYKPKEIWYDVRGKPFAPGVHYFVGGNTKVYGAALPRLRQEDFGEIAHEEGVSPAWPFTYAEMEPYYLRAEQILRV
ncbi:MAG: GMC family oxidoreductase, partial [Verrucomicrobia bacterium]|nr:GMC family oxidoreductase [Verrucomicrobiota bacterium]